MHNKTYSVNCIDREASLGALMAKIFEKKKNWLLGLMHNLIFK